MYPGVIRQVSDTSILMGLSPSKETRKRQVLRDGVTSREVITLMEDSEDSGEVSRCPSMKPLEEPTTKKLTKVETEEAAESSSSVTESLRKPQSDLLEDEEWAKPEDTNIAMYTDIKLRKRHRTEQSDQTSRRSPRVLSPVSTTTSGYSSGKSSYYKSSSSTRRKIVSAKASARSRRLNQTKNRRSSRNPELGDLGYTFTKYFEGHGWFTGKVVKIRYRAGRCL